MSKQEVEQIKNKLNNLVRLNFSVENETELYFESKDIKYEFFEKLKGVIDSINGELVEVDNIILSNGGLSIIINYLTNEDKATQIISELIWINHGFELCDGINYIGNETLYTDIVRFMYDKDETEIALLQFGLHGNV
jgi:hypothetical protein